jgi:DNA-binding winged helix-turn-helix (wHTH) protein
LYAYTQTGRFPILRNSQGFHCSRNAVKTAFGPFILDTDRHRLSRDGDRVELSPKAFDLLALLLERRPNVVDKATLVARIWPDTHVIEANLNILISEIRKALADTPRRRQFIETVHRVGFSFCGDAVDLDGQQPAARGALHQSRFWVAWTGGTAMLVHGDNIIGRDPNCHVFIDGDGVSRRHAKICVDSSRRLAVLEDLDSTNGTLLRHAPVASQVELADRDVITVGSVDLTFRVWLEDNPRRTERIRRSHS